MDTEEIKTKGSTCPQEECKHPFDPHILVALEGDPMLGGIILCPEQGCLCYSTWGAGKNSERPLVALTEDELTQLRTAVWTGEMS